MTIQNNTVSCLSTCLWHKLHQSLTIAYFYFYILQCNLYPLHIIVYLQVCKCMLWELSRACRWFMQDSFINLLHTFKLPSTVVFKNKCVIVQHMLLMDQMISFCTPVNKILPNVFYVFKAMLLINKLFPFDTLVCFTIILPQTCQLY